MAEEKETSTNLKKPCTHLKHWLHDHVINAAAVKYPLTHMSMLHSVWLSIINSSDDSIENIYKTIFSPFIIGYIGKWKKMHDYNNNYVHPKSAFKSKETCKEKYCKHIADIVNIYNKFLHVYTGTNEKRFPEYWNDFKKNFQEASKIETQCKEVYDKFGFYKIKMDLGEQGIEEYIQQYESEHTFSFIEKMISYNIKNILSKSIHFSKYSVLPILFILLFSFFLKKVKDIIEKA